MTYPSLAPSIGSLSTDIGVWVSARRMRRKAGHVSDADDDLLGGDDAATLAGVSYATLWRAGNNRELAYEEFGGGGEGGRKGNRRYRRADVEQWKAGRTKRVLPRLDEVERRLDEVTDRRLPEVERRLDEHERDHP